LPSPFLNSLGKLVINVRRFLPLSALQVE